MVGVKKKLFVSGATPVTRRRSRQTDLIRAALLLLPPTIFHSALTAGESVTGNTLAGTHVPLGERRRGKSGREEMLKICEKI